MVIEPQSKSTNRVLFVENEKKILKAIQLELNKTELELYMAQSGDDGLKILEREPIDLVVSDLSLPEMSGIDFLSCVKEEHQHVNRMLLTGEKDLRDINRAITRGFATTYLTKPWEKDILKNSVVHILEVREILKRKKLLEAIHEIDRLPSLPTIYQEFIEAVFNDKSASEIARIIERDVSIATRVLQVANSAFYGSVGLCSVDGSVVRLGLNLVKDMVLTLSFVSELNWSSTQLRHLENIFRHSSMVNNYFKQVYRIKNGVHLPSEVASIGLTHDIGNIIILQYFPERWKSTIKNQMRNPGMTFVEAERSLGYRWFQHEELGAYFLHMWNLPELMVEAALFHHRPELAAGPMRGVMEALSYADRLVSQVEVMRHLDVMDLSALDDGYLPTLEVERLAHLVREEFLVSGPLLV